MPSIPWGLTNPGGLIGIVSIGLASPSVPNPSLALEVRAGSVGLLDIDSVLPRLPRRTSLGWQCRSPREGWGISILVASPHSIGVRHPAFEPALLWVDHSVFRG